MHIVSWVILMFFYAALNQFISRLYIILNYVYQLLFLYNTGQCWVILKSLGKKTFRFTAFFYAALNQLSADYT